jgi:hypothetical protein
MAVTTALLFSADIRCSCIDRSEMTLNLLRRDYDTTGGYVPPSNDAV